MTEAQKYLARHKHFLVELDGITDQARKNHWWNVIARISTHVLPLALAQFDYFLKGGTIAAIRIAEEET